MFSSEGELHQWLRDELSKDEVEGLSHLIANSDYLESYQPVGMANKAFFDSFSKALQTLNLTEVIIDNQNMSSEAGSVLRPDFVLYSPECESISIVELKNFKKPTREAGTELGAYANEVKMHFPFISDGDVVQVIISPHWPTLLKRFVFHEVVWLHRKIICLEPICMDNEKLLKIKEIESLSSQDVFLSLSDVELGGYQICLYDDDLYKDENSKRLDNYLAPMKSALSSMSSKGSALRNHGFALLWKDGAPWSLAPYSITVINVAPFKLARKYMHDVDINYYSAIEDKIISLVDDYHPMGHSQSLQEISDSGNTLLFGFSNVRQEGYCDWGDHKRIMDNRASLLSFSCWGIFADAQAEVLSELYKKIGMLGLESNGPDVAKLTLKKLGVGF